MKKWTLATTLMLLGVGVAAPACTSGDDGDAGDGDSDGDGDGSGTGGLGNGTGGGTPGAGGNPGAGGTPGAGGAFTGGEGGDGGMGGGGGVSVPTVGCDGCAILYVPLSTAATGTDFEIDFGPTTTVDMSATTVTVRLQVVTTGNAGGVQLYLKNGEDRNWRSNYGPGWQNLTDLTGDFFEITIDLSAAAEPDGNQFYKSEVRYVGINVAAGDEWEAGGEMFRDTFVFVDSITFSDGATADRTFDADAEDLAVNIHNSPVAGSEIFHE